MATLCAKTTFLILAHPEMGFVICAKTGNVILAQSKKIAQQS